MNETPRGTVNVQEIIAYLQSDRYMSKAEAAGYLGLSISNVEKKLESIPHFRVGTKILFKKSELDKWMERHREATQNMDLDRIADEAIQAVLGPRKNR
jgi:excisionase family DNA binding protein